MMCWFKALVVLVVAFQVASVHADPFTYYPPGHLLKGSAVFGMSTGVEEYALHSPEMLFPLKAPAFANSQVYGFGGGKYEGKDAPQGWRDDRNYHYPWRDNFCEARNDRGHSAYVCPSHWAHQGQDIRPTNPDPAVHEVVAAEECYVRWINPSYGGVGLRSLEKSTTYHYLHMSSTRTVNGKTEVLNLKLNQVVHKGQVIGFASQVATAPTSVHVHFELLKMKRDANGRVINDNDGYAFVSPYQSLVAAYERLIGETGSMLTAPQVCVAEKTRCVPASGIYTKAALITCSADGTTETLSWCSGSTCSSSIACDPSGEVASPPDLATSPPLCAGTPVPTVSWTPKASLRSPPDFRFVSTVVAQNKLHFFGPTAVAQHRVYDPVTDSWSVMGPIPPGTVFPVIASAFKNTLYLYLQASDSPGIYVQQTDGSWSRVLATNFWLTFNGLSTSTDYLTYLLTPSVAGPAPLYSYHPDGNYWGILASRPQGMASGTVYYDASLYAFGGSDGVSVSRFSITESAWVNRAVLPSPTNAFAVMLHNNLVWAVGGTDSSFTPLDTVRLYNPAADTWCSNVLSLPTPIERPVIQAIGGKVYLLSQAGLLWEGIVK